jgi:hypothetical protein
VAPSFRVVTVDRENVLGEDTANLLSRPYAERQRLVVADDAVVEAERQVEANAADSGKAVDWGQVAVRAAALVPMTTVAVAAMATIGLAVETARAAARARERGVDVLTISRTEAQVLRLPPGHPRDRVLYVGHPAAENLYYPAAGFHRLTFEHKFAEAIRLLMSLGATELEVQHLYGWSNEFAANLDVPLASAGIGVGVKGGRKQSEGSSALFRATLRGSESPSIPADVVWYPHEQTWQPVAEGALRYGLRDFELTVRYDDDYGVDAGLKLAVEKAGLDVGGSFQEHVSTSWKISGKFGSRS